MKIIRIYSELEKHLRPNKVLVLYGPRQVGKTTLLLDYLKTSSFKYKLDTGDNLRTREVLSALDLDQLREYLAGYELYAIDEAQKVPRIGESIKIMVDQIQDIRVIATGSSSFELSGQVGEPLTGRKNTLILYPVSQIELKNLYNPHELKERLEEWLVFGGYPEVVIEKGKKEKINRVREIAESYLLRDILELERVKNSKLLLDLLRLVAFQVGHEVSLSELGGQLNIDSKTVARYLDLFEKSFVLFNLRGFSRNLRKEMTKKSKYYFYDTGIRNAIIANFNPLELRNDVGALWENFLFVERMKKRTYREIPANAYFWRTWDQKEIDLVEEGQGKLSGFEFKWGQKGKNKAPKEWLAAYPEATYEVITPENYLSFVT